MDPEKKPQKKRVDEEWKRQAEDEKKKIDSTLGGGKRGAPGGGPPSRISLISLFEQLAAQAMAGLGQVPDPRTGQLSLDLDFARDAIDMLALLDAKTRGNLDAEEERILTDILQSLENGYATIAARVGGAAGGPSSPGDEGGGGSPGVTETRSP